MDRKFFFRRGQDQLHRFDLGKLRRSLFSSYTFAGSSPPMAVYSYGHFYS